MPESDGYAVAWLYFSLDDDRRGAVKRFLDEASYLASPYFGAEEDVPVEKKWRKISVGHAAKSESISSFWLALLGVTPTKLRSNQSGGPALGCALILYLNYVKLFIRHNQLVLRGFMAIASETLVEKVDAAQEDDNEHD